MITWLEGHQKVPTERTFAELSDMSRVSFEVNNNIFCLKAVTASEGERSQARESNFSAESR